MTTTTEVSAMNKSEIIAELENMVVARLFGGQPWLADPETCSAVHRKLIQMGLWEQDRDQLRITPLGKELDVELFHVFLGVWHYCEVPLILEEYGLLSESEFYAICASDADAESLLSGYVKRAYFDYRKRQALALTSRRTASVEIAGASQIKN
jgi:hypothetical protein